MRLKSQKALLKIFFSLFIGLLLGFSTIFILHLKRNIALAKNPFLNQEEFEKQASINSFIFEISQNIKAMLSKETYETHNKFIVKRNLSQLQYLRDTFQLNQTNLYPQAWYLIQKIRQTPPESTEKMNSYKKEFIYSQGLYYFYDQQMSIINQRIKDYQEKENNIQNWYEDKIQKQATAYQSQWPIIPSLGISVGFNDAEYEKQWGRKHNAIDITTDYSRPVYAIADGEVIQVDKSCIYSNIKIKHQYEYTSIYGHVINFIVKKGDKVKRGDIIADTGGEPGSCGSRDSTGRHLHFGLLLKDQPIDPIYKFDMTFIPIEKLPKDFSLEEYYREIIDMDFNNNKVPNMYEFALKKDIYEKKQFDDNDLILSTRAVKFSVKPLI